MKIFKGVRVGEVMTESWWRWGLVEIQINVPPPPHISPEIGWSTEPSGPQRSGQLLNSYLDKNARSQQVKGKTSYGREGLLGSQPWAMHVDLQTTLAHSGTSILPTTVGKVREPWWPLWINLQPFQKLVNSKDLSYFRSCKSKSLSLGASTKGKCVRHAVSKHPGVGAYGELQYTSPSKGSQMKKKKSSTQTQTVCQFTTPRLG